MRRYLFYTLLTLLLFSCKREQQQAYHTQLQSWDSSLSTQPESVLDSLNTLHTNHLSQADRAYYHLLYTIASDKSYKELTNDSIISLATDWYSDSHDYYNTARAFLYKGLVAYRMGITDTSTYQDMKYAAEICETHTIRDDFLQGMIYGYLGKLVYRQYRYQSSNLYNQKAIPFFINARDTNNIIITHISIVTNYLHLKDYTSAKTQLENLEHNYTIPPSFQMTILHTYSTLYYTLEEYQMSLEYDRKQLLSPRGISQYGGTIYYSMSENFRNLHQPDSALFYARKAIELISDSSGLNYLYHENLAIAEQLSGNYKSASSEYAQAIKMLEAYSKQRSDTKISELEKKYDLTNSEKKLLKAQQYLWILLLTIAVILLLISWIWIYFHQKMIRQRQEKEASQREAELLRMEAELQKQKTEKALAQAAERKRQLDEFHRQSENATLIANIYETILRRNKGIEEQIEKIAQKHLKDDLGVYEELQNLLKQEKNENKKELFYLLMNEKNEEIKELRLNIPDLTTEEVILLTLLRYNWNSTQIAAILHIKTSNLATKKMNLKQKLQNSGYKFSEIDQLFKENKIK